MRKIIFTCFLLLIFCFSENLEAQNEKQINNSSLNISSPLTEKEKNFIIEAYSEDYLKLVLENENLEFRFKDILRNRVRFTEVIYTEKLNSFPLLSSIGYYTEVNNAVIDKPFSNTDSFNVLKYNFNFDSDVNYAVRIDNTNFILRIDSQFKK